MSTIRRKTKTDKKKVKSVWTCILEDTGCKERTDDKGDKINSVDDVILPEWRTQLSAQIAEKGSCESYVVAVGDKSAGKSTLINAFLNPTKEEKPKKTVGMEYSFGRRSNSSTSGGAKDIVHVWELSGGLKLKELISIPFSNERLSNTFIALFVDLSNPGQVLATTIQWLKHISNSVEEAIDALRKVDPSAEAVLQLSRKSRIPSSHPDSLGINPSVLPIVIVASKYDVFSELESMKRRLLLQALRFLAHVNGASLMCVSSKVKATLGYYRMSMNHYCFKGDLKKYSQLDTTKPLYIQAGSDTLESIGIPPGVSRSEFESSTPANRISKWCEAVEAYFPLPAVNSVDGIDSVDTSMYAEPSVDAMRGQKSDELARYRKEAERKAILTARAEASSSTTKVKKNKPRKIEESKSLDPTSSSNSGSNKK